MQTVVFSKAKLRTAFWIQQFSWAYICLDLHLEKGGESKSFMSEDPKGLC